MDYFSLAEQMLSVRARLSHLPAGEAISDACGGEFFRTESAAARRCARLSLGAAAQHGGIVGAHCGAFEAP